MAKVELEAVLEAEADTRVLLGRAFGLGWSAKGNSGQALGRRAVPLPKPLAPKPTLRVQELTVEAKRED